jgi:hypothetical protein
VSLALVVWLASGWFWMGCESIGVDPKSPAGTGWWCSLTIGRLNLGHPAHAAARGWGFEVIRPKNYALRWRLVWVRATPPPLSALAFGAPTAFSEWKLQLPLWMPTAVVLASTLIAWRLDVVARRRIGANRCGLCDYDCSGLYQGAVCPECGATARARR